MQQIVSRQCGHSTLVVDAEMDEFEECIFIYALISVWFVLILTIQHNIQHGTIKLKIKKWRKATEGIMPTEIKMCGGGEARDA